MIDSNARFQFLCRQLILLLLARIAKQQDSFYFDPAPINQDVLEGEPVKLRCDVSNRKMIYFYWTLNGRQLTNTSRRFQEDSDLRILWVDRHHDNGSLRCIATNVSTGIALRSAEARLNVLWISRTAEVHLRHPKALEDIAEWGEVQLRCAIEGHPEPTIDWYKNKVRIFASEHVQILRGRLRLVNVTAEDNGIYSCVGRNVAGQVDSTDNFLLNVAGDGLTLLKAESFIKFLLIRRTDPAMFHCEYDSAVISTEWHFEQKRLSNSAKHTVFTNGSLLIQSVNHSDVGYYRCVGVTETGPSQTFVAELRLAYLDEITDSLMDPAPTVPVIIPVNGKLDVRCHRPNGLPTPTLRWINPYNVEVAETDHRIKAVDGILSLNNVEDSDTGNYTCQASNMAATQSRSIVVIVSVAPKISRPPLSTRVQEGAIANFDCKVLATPYPVTTIAWTFEEGLLKNASGRLLVDERLGTLTVTNVHPADEGNYACVVRSRGHAAVISSNAHLYVEKKLKFNPAMTNTKLDLGSPGKIACHAEGRSTPSIRWLKDGRSDLPSHINDVEGVLHIRTVQYSDAGNYTCIATNEQGTINTTIRVDIVVKPRLQVKPVNTTVKEGLTAMFHCVAIGDPSPSVHWDHNSKVDDFNSDRIKVLPNGSLQVAPAYIEDSGLYGCTAGNSAGFTREEVFLRVLSELNFVRYQNNLEEETQSDEGSFSITKAVIIAVLCVAAYLTIVIGLTVYCSLRLVRARNLRAAATIASTPTEQTGLMSTRDSSIVKCDTDNRSHISGISSQQSQSSHSNPLRPLPGLRLIHDRLHFSRNQLQTVGMLGKCNYGDVFVAKAFNIVTGHTMETLVVVKSLLSQEEQHLIEAKADIETYSKANHPHVVRLLGICRELEPILAIYEYTDWGNLKQFLQLSQMNAENVPPLNYLQKLTMCIQVAQGMEHLSSLQLVHKDLAARNILVFPNFDVKIANLGLCRDAFASEYFLFHQHLIPLRWMPPEAVFEDKYSSKSDVWSYGVFVWEILSQASLPLIDKSNDEVLKGLKTDENKLSCPSTCPENVWTIVNRCEQFDAEDRPNFTELATLLNGVLAESIV